MPGAMWDREQERAVMVALVLVLVHACAAHAMVPPGIRVPSQSRICLTAGRGVGDPASELGG